LNSGDVLSRPSKKGKRFIINHVSSGNGFLSEAEDIFIGNMQSKDYHQEMNSKHFEEWFQTFLTYAVDKSVIILDMAKYHRRITKDTKNPTTSWNKTKIID